MPIVYRNDQNMELKCFLKKHGISYDMIAKKANYCYGTIAVWFRYPLTDYRKQVIEQAVSLIFKERDKHNEKK